MDAPTFKPPWLGTDYETQLKRIKINCECATRYPATDAGHRHFWNWIYTLVSRAVDEFKMERSESPSKRSKRLARIAGRLKRLADEIQSFEYILLDMGDPAISLPWEMRAVSERFSLSARNVARHGRGLKKRHDTEPQTRTIRELMRLVKHETGRWHDGELAALLNLAGLEHITAKSLSDYRRGIQ